LDKVFKLSASVIVLEITILLKIFTGTIIIVSQFKVTECAPSPHQEAGSSTGSALTPWGGCGQCWRRTGTSGPSHERLHKLSLSIRSKEWKVMLIII